MITLADFADPFDAVEEFEKQLGEFTGAKGVIATDCCTHAIELGIRYKKPSMYATLPAHTYLSVPMTLMKLDVDYFIEDEEWDKKYRIGGTHVWDCARMFEKDMCAYEPGQNPIMCLSFGHGKPLEIGHGGAILTNDRAFYEWAKKAAYDGRDLSKHKNNWAEQKTFSLGFHYHMRPEDAVIGLNKLANGEYKDIAGPGFAQYPDIREIEIE